MKNNNKHILGVIVVAALALAGPAAAQDDGMSPDSRKLQEELQAGHPGSTFFNDQFVVLRAYSPDEVNAMYRNQTNRYVHPDDGAQVEFTAADGSLYLWHPRNAQILRGQWRVDGGTHLCFDYTRATGGFLNAGHSSGWECRPISVPASIVQETLPGDVLNLVQTNNVPFRLRRDDRSTLAELSARIYANGGGGQDGQGSDDGAADIEDEGPDNRPWWRRVIGETPEDDGQENIHD